MHEYELVGAFISLFSGDIEFEEWCDLVGVDWAHDFSQAGLRTAFTGFVLGLTTGEEFQVRIVKSK